MQSTAVCMSDTRKHNFSDYLKLKKQQAEQPAAKQPAATQPMELKDEKVSWDDDFRTLEKVYATRSVLPPLLSPQLPSQYTEVPMIPVMLSPTLPPKYNKQQEGEPSVPSLPSPEASQVSDTATSNTDMLTTRRSVRYKRRKSTFYVVMRVPRWFSKKREEPETVVGLGLSVNTKNDKDKDKDKDKDDCLRRFEECLEIAKEKKHRADATRETDMPQSIVMFLDCIVVFLVGFHFEDQHRRLSKKLYNEKTWLSLVSLVDHVIKLSSDAQYEDMTGLFYQVRGVVYEHICRILDEYIQLDMVKRRRLKKAETGKELLAMDDAMVEHVRAQLRYRELSRRSFERGERALGVFHLMERYPDVVASFREQVNGPVDATDPCNGPIQLPVGALTTVSQLSALALRVGKLWAHKKDVRHQWTY